MNGMLGDFNRDLLLFFVEIEIGFYYWIDKL